MKKIKIKFASFWPSFNEEDNFIINTLKKHYEVELSDNPDYLFCSCFNNDFLKYDCVRIAYTGENWFPDFSYYDYAIGFEYLEYGDRYLRYPNWAIPELYKSDVELMQKKHEDIKENREKLLDRDFCTFVVSSGKGYVASNREDCFYKLSEYKKVASGGRYLNNIGKPEGVEDKLEFQSQHKFAIAFENTSMPGYSTEKIVQAFAAKTVPIYWGDTKIDEIFNPKAFIDANKFANLDEVLAEVKRLDADDEAYINMLEERALLDEATYKKYQSSLESFLTSIVDRDLEDAYRRDRKGYNKLKEDNFRELIYTSENTFSKKLRRCAGKIKHSIIKN